MNSVSLVLMRSRKMTLRGISSRPSIQPKFTKIEQTGRETQQKQGRNPSRQKTFQAEERNIL